MTRKQKRTTLIIALLAGVAIVLALVLTALKDTIVFFYTPADVVEKQVKPGVRIRLGGLVEKGSIERKEDQLIFFTVTDTEKKIRVAYKGDLPDLFREGQGVVAEGELDKKGEFVADRVLAKHDENYMPKEVADALKKKGVWQHGKSDDDGEKKE